MSVDESGDGVHTGHMDTLEVELVGGFLDGKRVEVRGPILHGGVLPVVEEVFVPVAHPSGAGMAPAGHRVRLYCRALGDDTHWALAPLTAS